MISVLYVDDEPDLLDLGKIFLETTPGFTVDTLISAVTALAVIPEKQYDAIVSDYQMPEMDGIAFLKAVRSSGNTIPFILFTGRGREEVVIQALNEGADFYLQKGGEPTSQFAELAHKIRLAVRQRRAEASVRDHERREADIINFLPDATFAIDTDGIVIAWNRAMETWTGVRAADILSKGNYEYALPIYHERRPILIDLVLKDDPATEARYPYVSRIGDTLVSEITLPFMNTGVGGSFWFTASPLYDTKGQIIGAIQSIRNITDRKRAEETLAESEERFRSLIQELPDGIIHISEDGKVIEWNKRIEIITGISRAEALEADYIDLLVPSVVPENRNDEYLAPLRESVHEALRTGICRKNYLNFEGPLISRDGNHRVIHQTAFPIKTAKGYRLGFIIRDVTEWREAQDTLKWRENLYRTHARVISSLMLDTTIFGDDTPRAVKKITESCSLLIPSGRISVWLYTDDYAIIRCIDLYERETDRHSSGEELKSADFPSYIARHRRGEVIAAVDVFTDPRTCELPAAYYHEHDIHSLLDVPVWIRDRIGGFLSFEYTGEQHQWTPEEEQAAASMATFLSLLLETGESTRTHTALAESERKYRTLFDNAVIGIFRYSPADNHLDINPAFARIFGYDSPQDYLQDQYTTQGRTFVLPQNREMLREMIATTGKISNAEVEQHHKDGHTIWIAINGRVVRNEAGDVTLIEGLIEDITARKRAEADLHAAYEQITASEEELRQNFEELAKIEEELRESEAKYRQIVETSIEGIWSMDSEFETVFVNQKMADMLGYTGEEMLGKQITVFMDPAELTDNAKKLANRQKGINESYERKFRRKDGSIRIFSVSVTAVMGPSGTFAGSFAMLTDITDRKLAEEAVQFKNLVLSTQQETSPDAIIVVDENAKILTFNRKFVELWNIPEDLIASRIDEPVLQHIVGQLADPETFLARVRYLYDHKEEKSFEELVLRDGRILERLSSPMLGENGKYYGRVWYFRDISRRKQQEFIQNVQLKLGLALQATSHLREALDLCLASAIEIAGMDAGGIYLVDSADGSLELAVSSGLGGEFVRLGSHYTPDSENARIVMAGNPLYMPDRITGIIDTAAMEKEGLLAIGIIPIASGGQVIASLNVTSRTRDEIPVPERVALETISSQIGAAILRIRSEEALRESEEKYRQLFEAESDALFLIDNETGQILQANMAASAMYGYPKDELQAMRNTELSDELKETRQVTTETPITPDTVVTIPLRWHRKRDGSRFPVEITGRFFVIGGRSVHIAAIRDITDRMQAEEALRTANRKLNLLSGITRHDINNQLSIIRGYFDLLSLSRDESVRYEYQKKIGISARRIAAIIQFTKDYEEIGIRVPDWHNLKSVAGTAAQQAPPGSFSVINDIPENLEVFADALILRVFYNLMDNAARYGGKISKIRFSILPKESHLVIICEDDGEGIPADQKERIFERGFGKNTGLGLFLAREILSITGVTIAETGEPGKGARFEISVPKGAWRDAGKRE